VCIDFKLFLREEKKFDSIEELINAMASDVALVANSE
jgi:FAD synthase